MRRYVDWPARPDHVQRTIASPQARRPVTRACREDRRCLRSRGARRTSPDRARDAV